jgi:hypothetical protein
MNIKLSKLFEKTKHCVAEERTRLFEERRGTFKSKASRKKYYDNQLKQIKIMKLSKEV